MLLSISERISYTPQTPEWARRSNRILLRDTSGWCIGQIHNEYQLKEVLDFLGY